MTIVLVIIFSLAGYYYARWQNKKKLEVARLIGIRDFIFGYCEQLRGRCESILEKVKEESINEDKKNLYAPMLSALSNTHDELIEIWEDTGEIKLSVLLGGNIRDIFGVNIDKKMSNLIKFEDELSAEDENKALEHIAGSLQRIKEFRLWLDKYINNSDGYIKAVAIEASALLDVKESVLRVIETGLNVSGDIAGDEAKAALGKQALHTKRYLSAMRLLSGS